MKLHLSVIAGLAIVFSEPAFAQQTPTCDGPQDACQEIVDALKQFEAAYSKKDAKGIGSLFTADAVLVGEGPIVSGREAIEKFYDDGFKAGFRDNSSPIDQVHVNGNIAWIVGHWSAIGPGPNNSTQRYHGNWSAVDVHEGSSWKGRMITFNTIENREPER